ncbi:hypothetical protein D043_3801A, partial [Vibrio parahaemolyticus EKP-021]
MMPLISISIPRKSILLDAKISSSSRVRPSLSSHKTSRRTENIPIHN